MNIKEFIHSINDEIKENRRHFHMHPELSKKEFQTQKKIIEILNKYNIKYQKAATTGVVAYVEGKGKGKCVAIRADIDALPILEKNTIPYKSQNEGVMHACGHDAHTAILLGTCITLNKFKESFRGTIKCFFQPDEEVSAGAKRIVEEGFMTNPKVDYIIGLHVMPYIDSGKIEVKYGKLNASLGTIKIVVNGKSSHAAYPETGIDAIAVSAQVINNLQSIISRNISPLNQVVLSFGTIKGGIKSNIIPSQVEIEGSLRTTDQFTRELMVKRIKEVTSSTCKAFNATGEVIYSEGYMELVNDDCVINKIIEVAKEEIGTNNIIYKEFPSMGGEDFGYYLKDSQGAFFHLGCGNITMRSSTHTDTFDIDESCLELGVLLQVKNAIKLLSEIIH